MNLLRFARPAACSPSPSRPRRTVRSPAPRIKLHLMGSESGAAFGHAVAGIGDVTGDGGPEIAVGAPGSSPPGTIGAGAVRVYSARSGELRLLLAGPEDGAKFGSAVAAVGDADGDATPDLVVGAESAWVEGQGHAGRALVHSGRTGSLIFAVDAEWPSSTLGRTVSGAGDVNGDGLADVIVGAPEYATYLFFFGQAIAATAPDGAKVLHVAGTNSFDLVGSSVSDAGDVDQDGYDDVAIGAYGADVVSVYSVRKQLILAQMHGNAPGGSWLGTALANAGDLDADGIPDLLIGAASPSGGKVLAWSPASPARSSRGRSRRATFSSARPSPRPATWTATARPT